MNHLWEAVEFFYYKHPWNFLWIRICGRSSWWSGEIRLSHVPEDGFHSKMILVSFNLVGEMLSITALSVLVPVIKLMTATLYERKFSRLSLYLMVLIDTLSRSHSCLDFFPSFLCNSKKSRQMDELCELRWKFIFYWYVPYRLSLASSVLCVVACYQGSRGALHFQWINIPLKRRYIIGNIICIISKVWLQPHPSANVIVGG